MQYIRRTPIAPSGGRTESLCRGLSGMDAARAAMGQGWPFAAGPRSNDGVRGVERSETRMQGHRPFGSFWGVCQKELAVRAKTVWQAINRRRRSAIPRRVDTTARNVSLPIEIRGHGPLPQVAVPQFPIPQACGSTRTSRAPIKRPIN